MILTRHTLRFLTLAAAGLVALGLVAALAGEALLRQEPVPGIDPVGVATEFWSFFHLDREMNAPAWFSASLLLLCSLRLIGLAEQMAEERHPFARRWAVIGGVFFYVALDESVSIHERSIVPLREALGTGGIFYFAWVIPGLLLVLGLAVYTLPAVMSLPGPGRNAVIAAACLYVGGALGVEMIGGWWADRSGTDSMAYMLITWVEESLEIAGTVVFLHALHGPWFGVARVPRIRASGDATGAPQDVGAGGVRVAGG